MVDLELIQQTKRRGEIPEGDARRAREIDRVVEELVRADVSRKETPEPAKRARKLRALLDFGVALAASVVRFLLDVLIT